MQSTPGSVVPLAMFLCDIFSWYTRLPARNDDEKDDAEEDGGDGGDPDQAAHRLLELLEREGDHEGEDDRQLSEHEAINLELEVYNWGSVGYSGIGGA